MGPTEIVDRLLERIATAVWGWRQTMQLVVLLLAVGVVTIAALSTVHGMVVEVLVASAVGSILKRFHR